MGTFWKFVSKFPKSAYLWMHRKPLYTHLHQCYILLHPCYTPKRHYHNPSWNTPEHPVTCRLNPHYTLLTHVTPLLHSVSPPLQPVTLHYVTSCYTLLHPVTPPLHPLTSLIYSVTPSYTPAVVLQHVSMFFTVLLFLHKIMNYMVHNLGWNVKCT